jgi:hypothetical protein
MYDGRAAMPIAIDDTRRPLIVVTFVGSATDAEFDAYLDAMATSVLARRERTVTLLDATRSDATPAAQRRRQAEWLKTHDAELRRYSLGTAFVIRSPIVRGVLTAILWIQPMSVPYTVVATRNEGEAWAAEMLSRAGLRLPDR